MNPWCKLAKKYVVKKIDKNGFLKEYKKAPVLRLIVLRGRESSPAGLHK